MVQKCILPIILNQYTLLEGAQSITIIIMGKGVGDPSSKPGQDYLHFTYADALMKDMYSTFLPTPMDK